MGQPLSTDHKPIEVTVEPSGVDSLKVSIDAPYFKDGLPPKRAAGELRPHYHLELFEGKKNLVLIFSKFCIFLVMVDYGPSDIVTDFS